MSFKREGNDKGLLDSLRRRRVKELLGEDIPEDEAKLLCNGRFACLVCSHNPVFDTVNMLMVHRQGKKHAASEEIFLRKKKELQALILKRKHEQYRKDGTTVIKQAMVSSAGGIMASQPYDPRVKKHKVKPYERKPCLDLHSDFGSSQSSNIDAASGSQAFPTAVPMKHGHQLKNIFQSAQRTTEPVRPYVRQHKTFTDNSTSCHPTHSNQFPVSVSSSDRSISQTSIYTGSHYCELGSLTAASVSSSHSGFVNVPDTSLSVNTSSSSAFPQGRTFMPNKTKFLKQDINSSRTSLQSSGNVCSLDGISDTKGDEVERSSVSHSVQAADKPGCVSVGSSLGSSTEKQQLAQKYYHLSGSGWKKDWDGKWIRDEEAEFDSDEEPPDLP